jgi:hypothetical protein
MRHGIPLTHGLAYQGETSLKLPICEIDRKRKKIILWESQWRVLSRQKNKQRRLYKISRRRFELIDKCMFDRQNKLVKS